MSTAHPLRSRASVTLVAVLTLVLAGCGGSSATTAKPAAATPAQVATPAAAGATDAGAGSGAGSGTGDCGAATAAEIMKILDPAQVASVTADGGCHDANIQTKLGPTEIKAALDICDAASKVAYDGDMLSVTVVAANAKELAISVKDQACIGEP